MKRILSLGFTAILLVWLSIAVKADQVDDYVKAEMERHIPGLSLGKVLNRSSLEQMWTPARLNDGNQCTMGLGWGIGLTHGRRGVGHSGDILGFSGGITLWPATVATGRTDRSPRKHNETPVGKFNESGERFDDLHCVLRGT
jgi:hypothetical protein